jgi:hypothetical protein
MTVKIILEKSKGFPAILDPCNKNGERRKTDRDFLVYIGVNIVLLLSTFLG